MTHNNSEEFIALIALMKKYFLQEGSQGAYIHSHVKKTTTQQLPTKPDQSKPSLPPKEKLPRPENATPPKSFREISLKLSSKPEIKPESYEDLSNLMRTHFPEFLLYPAENSENQAEVLVLSIHDEPLELRLLENLAQAISRHLVPAVVISASQIETMNQWDTLLSNPKIRLTLACSQKIPALPALSKICQAYPSITGYAAGNTPLLLLEPISSYLQDPTNKAVLWKKLNQLLYRNTFKT